jgi:hypothetical protein
VELRRAVVAVILSKVRRLTDEAKNPQFGLPMLRSARRGGLRSA